MAEISTKPYMLRALYEWCCDSGSTPYIVVRVDANTRVPRRFVSNGEIVLNVSPMATSHLQIGNERIEFQARFNGVAENLSIPVGNVAAIYARETGQGMAFEVQLLPEPDDDAAAPAGSASVSELRPGARPPRSRPRAVETAGPASGPRDRAGDGAARSGDAASGGGDRAAGDRNGAGGDRNGAVGDRDGAGGDRNGADSAGAAAASRAGRGGDVIQLGARRRRGEARAAAAGQRGDEPGAAESVAAEPKPTDRATADRTGQVGTAAAVDSAESAAHPAPGIARSSAADGSNADVATVPGADMPSSRAADPAPAGAHQRTLPLDPPDRSGPATDAAPSTPDTSGTAASPQTAPEQDAPMIHATPPDLSQPAVQANRAGRRPGQDDPTGPIDPDTPDGPEGPLDPDGPAGSDGSGRSDGGPGRRGGLKRVK